MLQYQRSSHHQAEFNRSYNMYFTMIQTFSRYAFLFPGLLSPTPKASTEKSPPWGPGSTQPRTQARARRAFGTSRRLAKVPYCK